MLTTCQLRQAVLQQFGVFDPRAAGVVVLVVFLVLLAFEVSL
jgi:hypothetical protein